MTNFTVPYLEEDNNKVSPAKASQDAFYAAGASGSDTPVEDYLTIKSDLQESGQSDKFSEIQTRLQAEEDVSTRDTMYGIMQDESISPELRRSVIQSYAITGTVPSTIKNKYITKVAQKDNSISIDELDAQDEVIAELPKREADNESNINFDHVSEGAQKLLKKYTMDSAVSGTQAGASILSSILMSIPAGFAGIYHAITEDNPEAASNVIAAIQQAAYMPEDKGAQHVKEAIMEGAATLSAPAKWIGDFLNTANFAIIDPKTGEIVLTPLGAGVATTGELVLDPLNYIPLGALKATRGVPKVKPDSPLEATRVANPKEGEELAMTTLKTNNLEVENAVGATAGEIVHDWVLPKALPDEMIKERPDLHARIVADDEKIKRTFVDFRYDPNIIDVTKREAEVGAVLDILHNSSGYHYIQSKSLINETDEAFKGNAVFGRKNGEGYATEGAARAAYNKLIERTKDLPEGSGTIDIVKFNDKYFVNWQWQKQYDDIKTKMFGPDAVQTSFLGFDVSGIARKPIGRWLFPTGRFAPWNEQAALRGIERTAVIRNDLVNTIKERVRTHGHGEELDFLINEAEAKGIDYFSPDDIARTFPNMKKKEVDALFETHTFWRRQQHYNHTFLNREMINRLEKAEMQGIYDKNGTYLGAGTTKVSPAELIDVKELWDLDKKVNVPYNAADIEAKGYQVVRLHEKVDSGDSVFHYGLVGKDTALNLLPQEVLPRLPGYSGRKVKESWYIDSTPKKLNINGKSVTDSAKLASYSKTKAAAKDENTANRIAQDLQMKNPDLDIKVRPERSENFGRVMTDYQIHQNMLSHSMKRGERLPSLYGPARLEDRMTTLLNTANSLARMGALRAWDDAFQSAFTKEYAQFSRGKFPEYIQQIEPLENMNRDMQKQFENARAQYKWYERIKNSETFGDFHWTKFVNSIAEVAEKMNIPADWLRGKHENPLMLAKKVAFIDYIILNPIRQHLIQPAQQIEMNLINPKNAPKNIMMTAAIRMRMFADSKLANNGGIGDIIRSQSKSIAERAGGKEFDEIYEAISRSGMLQSVDMNMIVAGMIRDVNRGLVEGVTEKTLKDLASIVKKPAQLAREYGFDAAELTNRVGMWLQVKDLWIEKNPGKSWKTKENIEEISSESLKLAGAMNRAGQLPFQEGILSVFFQFAAIQHKMFMNLLQDNATILSGTQRAKLAAWRFAVYGGAYGVPGGVVLYNFIDKSEDPLVKENANLVRRGLVDYATNATIAAIVEPDVPTDLAVSKSLSPYSDHFSPYFAFMWETAKLFDDKPAGPRYPAFGVGSAMMQAVEDMKGWYVTRDVNETTFPQAAMEAAELAAGFNNYWQGQLMLGMKDKVTKSGNKYGLTFSKQEAYARMFFGVPSQKEEDLWKVVELEGDKKRQKAELAKMIYRQLENQRIKGNEDEYATRIRKINSFLNMLDPQEFSDADRLDVVTEFEKIDQKKRVDINQSVLLEHYKYQLENRTTDRQQIDDILNRTQDPTTQKVLRAMKEGKL